MIVEDSDPKLFELGLPLAGVVWTAVLAGAVVEGRVGTALAWSPLRWLGDRSYAIYLIHVAVMAATVAVNRTTPSVAAAVDAEVAATVTTAAITATTTTSTPFRPRSSRSSSGAAPVVSPARSTAPEVAPTTTTSTVPAATPPPVVQRRPIRVLALGDSTMRHLTEPLEAWLALFGGEVVPRAVPGCSPLSTAPDPLEVRFDDTPKGQVPAGVCRPSVRDVIDRVGPVDVVVIVDHGMAVLDHRVPDGGHWSSLRNADIRGRLAHRYIAWARPRRSAHPWCW